MRRECVIFAPMNNLFKVLRYAKNYRGYALLNILFNILSVIFSLFSIAMIIPFLNLIFKQGEQETETAEPANDDPSYTDQLKDQLYDFFNGIVERNGQEGALLWLCVMIVVMIFLKNIFRYLAMYYIARVRAGAVRDLRRMIYDKALRLPLSFYSGTKKGDIMARMTSDVQEIEWTIMTSLEMIFRDPVSILLFLATLLIISPTLTLAVLLLLPFTGLIIGRIGKSLKKTSVKGQKQMGNLMTIIEESLGGLRIIKAFNAEDPMRDKFDYANNRYRRLMVRMYNKRDLSSPLSEFLGVLVMVGIIWMGGSLILNGDSSLDASQFIYYIAIFSQLIPPAKSVTQAYYNIKKGAASVDRINELMDAEETIREKDGALEQKTFEDRIEFKSLSFRYETEDVLKNINLTIKKGETIALVGPSGGGKSTLADLLPRFHDPVEGEVCLDGTTLKDIKVSNLRSLMGIVTQQSILFNDTIANNIAFGMKGVDRKEIENAARIANAHEFISQMENGYDTNIGDGGGKLSGGQRQRISIARAILKNPPILILDEATSALDTESEKLVQDALNKLMENRTSLVIAHRLSTIQNADRIVVIEAGEIKEEGSHEELLKIQGTYKKLYNLQSFE